MCSAGNDGVDTDVNTYYPAGYDSDNIIVVGSLDSTLTNKRTDSNYGATGVDVFAPGTSVYTTANDGDYDTFNCTSCAAPFVTGLAALMWEANPNLTPQKIIEIIKNNVDKPDSLNGKCTSGGKINAFKALRAAMTTSSDGTYYSPRTLVGDINGDGIEDQVISGRLNGYLRLSVFLGKSDGSF